MAGSNPIDLDSLTDTEHVRKATLGKIAELLDRNGIDVEDIGRIHKINVWQGFYKDKDGESHLVDMSGIQLAPTWETGPEWPVVQQAAPAVVKCSHKPKPRDDDAKVTVLLPDPQIGYLRYEDGTLVPLHDEAAMACAIELITAIQPDRIINLGDFLDLAEFSSKFAVSPEMVFTTQPAIDRGHRFLVEQRAAAGPDCDMNLLGGNHDDRLALSVLKNALAALRLRQANAPESWPVLSIPYLLRLDELDVTYTGAYPAGRLLVADAHGEQAPLVALHGKRLDMIKQAKSARHSTIQGHSHHVSVHSETYDDGYGNPVEVESWSIGCLARKDGAVPSTGGATDDRGKVVPNVESWQHAIAVVTETTDNWWLEPIRIHNGRARYGRAEYGCGE